MNSSRKNAVIAFARFPVEGKVKTRLAKTMGEKFATGFYKICAQHTFAELNKIKNSSLADIFIFSASENETEKLKQWIGQHFNYFAQKGTGLGERMYNAFRKVFESGFENVLIIGTDAPGISSGLIGKAFGKLKEFDVVIGPSNDGGYYLLGLKYLQTALFEKIEWSSDSVLSNTVDVLKKKQLQYFLLPELIDIDTEDDFKNWITSIDKEKNYVFKHLVKQKIISNDFLP